MKKRKFVAMTNWEYFLRKCKTRGVASGVAMCPYIFGLENYYMACGVRCESVNDCGKCWELPAIVNGRYILKEVKEKRLTYLERKYLDEGDV